MRVRRPRALVLAILLSRAAIVPLQAQVSFSPTIGAYLPTSNVANVLWGSDSVSNLKQDVGIALGGTLGVGLSSRVGLQFAGTYVPSQLSGTLSGTGTFTPSKANLFFGNANLVFYLIPPSSPLWISLHGGASMVSRSGAAYRGVTGTTDFGGLAGATIGVHLGSLLNLHLSATDYIYGAQFVRNGVSSNKVTQNDVLLGLGLGIPLGK